jgi:hypothetical protein
MVASKELKSQVNRLTLADRFRLLHWLAERDPGLVRRGVMSLGTRADITILAWSINGMDAPATEGAAGDSDPPAAMG